MGPVAATKRRFQTEGHSAEYLPSPSTARGKCPLVEIPHTNKNGNQLSLGMDTLDRGMVTSSSTINRNRHFPESFTHAQIVDTRPLFPPPMWPGYEASMCMKMEEWHPPSPQNNNNKTSGNNQTRHRKTWQNLSYSHGHAHQLNKKPLPKPARSWRNVAVTCL